MHHHAEALAHRGKEEPYHEGIAILGDGSLEIPRNPIPERLGVSVLVRARKRRAKDHARPSRFDGLGHDVQLGRHLVAPGSGNLPRSRERWVADGEEMRPTLVSMLDANQRAHAARARGSVPIKTPLFAWHAASP